MLRIKLSSILLFIFLILSPGITEAKIVADQERNNSFVFYFWDGWHRSGTVPTYLTFLKLISSDESEKYWIRLDSFRNTVLPYGKIIVDDREYIIEQIENPTAFYYRTGLSTRSTIRDAQTKAFFDLNPEIIEAIRTSTKRIIIMVNFQTRADLDCPLNEGRISDFKSLITLKKVDFPSYDQRPSK